MKFRRHVWAEISSVPGPPVRATMRGLAVVLFAWAALCTLGTLPCAAELDLDSPVPTDPYTRIGSLDNGMRYYIRPNTKPENRAELRLALNAGSILEAEDQLGLAHFVEHMAFNGSEHFEKNALIDYMEGIGMRFGPHVNAYTSFDATVYMLTVPTDDREILEQAFVILGDWADGLSFVDEEVDKERGVVIEEWRGRRGANQRIRDQLFPVLFEGSLYAERLPIGTKESLEGFPHESLIRYYEDWYRPDLMAVVAVGDFDADEIQALIEKTFGGLENPPDEQPREYADVPFHEETRFAVATDPEQTSTRVEVSVKVERRRPETIGDNRDEMVESLALSMFNARLGELTRTADPPYIGAYASGGSLARTVDSYGLSVVVENNGVERGLEAALTEAARLSRHGFTQTELDRQKARTMSRVERQYNERDKTNSSAFASNRISHFLDGWTIPGAEFIYEQYSELLPGITLDEVNAKTRDWFAPENRVITISAPEKEGVVLPDEEQVMAVFSTVAASDIGPYVDEVTDALLVAEMPVPGEIIAESYFEELDLYLWTLSNGMRVFLKSTDFKDDQIIFRAYSPGGSSLASDDGYLSAELASFIVGQSGLGEFDPIALGKRLAGKQVRVSPYIGSLQEGMGGGGTPGDIETLFQLIYLNFTNPRRDEEAFSGLVKRMEGFLANRASNPQAVFADSMSLILSQYHPRAQPLTAERVGDLDLDYAYDFYRDRFAEAGDFSFVFVGSFALEQMRPLVQQYLASLPTIGRQETWVDLGIEPPTGVIDRSFRKGLEDKSQTQIVFNGPFVWNRTNRYALQSLGDVLRIRLREVLREDLGGVYGVSITASRTLFPRPDYSVAISFGCDPARLEELTGEVFGVISEIKQEGVSDENLGKVAEAQRREIEVGMEENGFWLGQISYRDQHEIPLLEMLDFETMFESLNSDMVKGAANLYLRTDNYVQISMFPEEGAETKESEEPGR